MTEESITTFVTGYLQSLAEETRPGKKGPQYGFDHVIFQIAQAEQWIPLRIAFHRGGMDTLPRPKKEAEHGIDLKFISQDRTELITFVLKGVPLTYSNWTGAGFDKDLRMASNEDLTLPEYIGVQKFRLILVYNKDEEEEGLEEYERFVKSRGKLVSDRPILVQERWNLDRLTEIVRQKLLFSPVLVPQRFFKALSYLCWQVADFSHGSAHWNEILIPDWKQILSDMLQSPVNERNVRIVIIALGILRSHGKNEPAFETGWIELLEWAQLSAHNAILNIRDKKTIAAVNELWILYLQSLEEYYGRHEELLRVGHSLSAGRFGSFDGAAASYFAFWHMGRLGILALALMEIKSTGVDAFDECLDRTISCLVATINANPACSRPLLDIHHIELYLFWLILSRFDRHDELAKYFLQLHDCLLHRRLGHGGVRLIDQSNSWESLLEYIATGQPTSEAFGRSSYLLQMLIEIFTNGLGDGGPPLLQAYYTHLIEGKGDDGKSFEFKEKVELQSWAPPTDWSERILVGSLAHEGICISINGYLDWQETDYTVLPQRVEEFIREARKQHPFEWRPGIPPSVLVLACILHKSPLPPDFWRAIMLGVPESSAGMKKRPVKSGKRKTKQP